MASEKRLIDANALLEKVQFRLPIDSQTAEVIAGCVDITRRLIENSPTVDAVEVVHGCNVYDHDTSFECSICGWGDWDTLTADTAKYNYCPNCGAKMDGERREGK